MLGWETTGCQVCGAAEDETVGPLYRLSRPDRWVCGDCISSVSGYLMDMPRTSDAPKGSRKVER